MNGESATGSRVYCVGVHLLIVLGIAATILVAIGIVILVKSGEWKFLACVAGGTALAFLLVQILRLEIGPSSFKYRNLSGVREVTFADVGRAYFEVIETSKAPQGVAVFYVDRRKGGRVKINLRTFSVAAAADLFTALESHGIQIEVPDRWASRRMADEILAEQAKTRS